MNLQGVEAAEGGLVNPGRLQTALNARSVGYAELLASFRKGLRNNNWKQLRRLEKALYQAALWYAKRCSGIVNPLLIEKLSCFMARLNDTRGARVFRRGSRLAATILANFEEEGAFTWAPQLKEWLKDFDYIFWLGASFGRYHRQSKTASARPLRT